MSDSNVDAEEWVEEEWVEYDGGATQEWHWKASRIRVAPDVTVIPEEAFEECESLRVVDLSNATIISDNAFQGCHSLERVVWTTNAAVEIGVRAFEHCMSLKEIDLGNVTKIGWSAFAECHSLESVALLSSTEIGGYVFDGCESLAEVELGEGMQLIPEGAFNKCDSLVRIAIPASVTDIGPEAFSSCHKLQEVQFNEGLQCIGEDAFRDCSSMSHVKLPSTVLKVGDYAFERCRQLRRVEFQEGLQMIEAQAFRECSSLERIAIPSSTVMIGEGAFESCTSLSEVTLREGVHLFESLQGNPIFRLPPIFRGCTSLPHINIPPAALVVDMDRSSCHLMQTTMPKPDAHSFASSAYFGLRSTTLVVSKWMQHRSPVQLEQAESKVNEILGRQQLTMEEKVECLREWSAYYDTLDVTTLLELAIWKANMGGNEQESEARTTRRRSCGRAMTVIIPGVISFLGGL